MAVEHTTSLSKIVSLITFLLALCQIGAYSIACLARVDLDIWLTNLAWYQFPTTTTSGSSLDFYLGLQGYYNVSSSASTYTAYADANGAFSDACESSGFRGFILVVIATFVSSLLVPVSYVRRYKSDGYPVKLFGALVAAASVVLSVNAYAYFYTDCRNDFFDFLVSSPNESTVHYGVWRGGYCLGAGAVCGAFTTLLAVVETLAEYLGFCKPYSEPIPSKYLEALQA